MNYDEEENNAGKDPMRSCYICRMPISVLATRCRYCGAEVGRPRKEQEKFTVADLGGEKVGTYTVSGNVTDAFESFIQEEREQLAAAERERLEAEQRTLAGRLRRLRQKDSQLERKEPDLDFTVGPADINNISLSSRSTTSTTPRRNSLWDTVAPKLFTIAALIVALVALYFIADFAWAWVRSYYAEPEVEEVFIYPNRAREILAEGGGLLQAHEEAMIALRHNQTDENREIAREIRERIIEDVQARAFATPFDMTRLSEASRDITLAGQRDSDPKITAVMDAVNREVGYFAFILTQLDPENESATFRLNNPGIREREQTVEVGDLLQNRFLVQSISSRGVILEDSHPETRGRLLISKRMLPVDAY